MKKIVAETLQGAITQASLELGCSVTELDYEIIQIPSKGFFGAWKKDAIIVAAVSSKNALNQKATTQPQKGVNEDMNESVGISQNIQTKSAQYAGGKYTERENFNENKEFGSESNNNARGQETSKSSQAQKYGQFSSAPDLSLEYPNENQEFSKSHHTFQNHFEIEKNDIDDAFYQEIQDPQEVAREVENELIEMFVSMPYKISHICVKVYDPQTLLIELDGDDSALMIGEKGYRYKALSYLLFNWINPKYGYNIRLEIAQFLRNQEEAMDVYLQGIIANIQEFGKAQTKPLDGVLGYIALRKLRKIFPNKYVSFRLNALNERYIIVNDFIKNG